MITSVQLLLFVPIVPRISSETNSRPLPKVYIYGSIYSEVKQIFTHVTDIGYWFALDRHTNV